MLFKKSKTKHRRKGRKSKLSWKKIITNNKGTKEWNRKQEKEKETKSKVGS